MEGVGPAAVTHPRAPNDRRASDIGSKPQSSQAGRSGSLDAGVRLSRRAGAWESGVCEWIEQGRRAEARLRAPPALLQTLQRRRQWIYRVQRLDRPLGGSGGPGSGFVGDGQSNWVIMPSHPPQATGHRATQFACLSFAAWTFAYVMHTTPPPLGGCLVDPFPVFALTKARHPAVAAATKQACLFERRQAHTLPNLAAGLQQQCTSFGP